MSINLPSQKYVTTFFIVLDRETKMFLVHNDGCNLIASDANGTVIAFYVINPPFNMVGKLAAFDQALRLMLFESADYAKSWYPCFYAV